MSLVGWIVCLQQGHKWTPLGYGYHHCRRCDGWRDESAAFSTALERLPSLERRAASMSGQLGKEST